MPLNLHWVIYGKLGKGLLLLGLAGVFLEREKQHHLLTGTVLPLVMTLHGTSQILESIQGSFML